MHKLTDEYRLMRRLGSGGMGEVWEAARVKNDIVVPCAIKLLHADFTETARERRLFFDEARIATQLDHSRIVKVTDLGTAPGGQPFLVMERVDGVDLRHFLKAAAKESSTPLEFDVVAYVVGEVLAGLAYAHGRTVGGSDAGIIHSDVTPGNILISSSGEVKLTDFGIARFAAVAAPMSRAIGTPRYMSPEQLCGEPQRETDIYGLGVILHELLEDKRFLDGLTPDQFRSRVLMGPPPDLTREGVPEWLDELRRRMIATDPKQRPQASEARAVLIEHCPGYAAATVRLQADYTRLIGRRRSGVTALDVPETAGATALLPPPTGAEESPGDSKPREAAPGKNEEGEVAPTELLPTTGPSNSQLASFRGLALASSLAAAAMLVLALTFLVQTLRDPAAPGPGHTKEQREVAVEAERSSTPTEARVFELASAPPQPTTPEPIVLTQTVDLDPLEAEAEQPEPPTPKPAPKTLPKIGVVFLIETNLEGRIKAGRKIIAVKNRSGYAELPPGKYKVSWQPKGSDEWQLHGRVTLEDISPGRYKVRLDEGKIVEVGEL